MFGELPRVEADDLVDRARDSHRLTGRAQIFGSAQLVGVALPVMAAEP